MPKLFSKRRVSAKQLLGIANAKRSFSRKSGLGKLKSAMKPQNVFKQHKPTALEKAIKNTRKRRYLFGIIPLW